MEESYLVLDEGGKGKEVEQVSEEGATRWHCHIYEGIRP